MGGISSLTLMSQIIASVPKIPGLSGNLLPRRSLFSQTPKVQISEFEIPLTHDPTPIIDAEMVPNASIPHAADEEQFHHGYR
jgi:hypothetical protein